MGLDDRLSIAREGFDLNDPKDNAIIANASQPPIGCSYAGTGVPIALPAGVATTVPFNIVTPTVYDPYHLISTTTNGVTVPFPGVWDIDIQIRIAYGAGTTNSYLQFGQTLTPALTDNGQMCAGVIGGAGSCPIRLSDHFYCTRAMLGSGSVFSMTALCLGGAACDVALVSFRMWLRSAVIPSKY